MPYIKAIQYLTADYQPTRVQTAQGIQRLTKNLSSFDLTKAEKLQIVNLTPVEPVELYVVRPSGSSPQLARSFFFSEQIVEELEDRLGNSMEEVLSVVRSSLTAPPPLSAAAATASTTGAELAPSAQPRALEIVDETPASAIHDDLDLDAPLWEHDPNEVEMHYMDGGEGVGIEGDLDVDDDE